MTKYELLQLLFTVGRNTPVHSFRDSNGVEHIGVLQGIQREDGSGRSFNITIRQTAVRGSEGKLIDMHLQPNTTFHMRTTD